jgi:hypothetical protein
MNLNAAKRITVLIFGICACLFPAIVAVSLWADPLFFANIRGEAVCGYFTLIVGMIATSVYMLLGRRFAEGLCLEFCRMERQLDQPAHLDQRYRLAALVEAIQKLGDGRAYYWFLLPFALGVLAFYGAALLIDLYLAFDAATLPLVFIALVVLASSLFACLALPWFLFAQQRLDPVAILARLHQETRARHH